ncbi:MAG: 3-hydroxyacyl-CoA dehydrogenase/enoyl-CoA hydratase family protein [Candidatus Zixiibacteriota bacterium]
MSSGNQFSQCNWHEIEILIVGAGTMGASLAQTYAQNGFKVGMLDVNDAIIQSAFGIIGSELESARGRIFSDSEIEAIRGRIVGGIDYKEACPSPNMQLVIEAATERIDIKEKIFKTLDELCCPSAVLATNSSSLDTNILARATKRPDKVVWMHYFYLPHRNRAGEFAGTDSASEESIALAERYMKLGGKIPTHIRGSRKGGVADIIFVALLLEATRMLEEGYDIPTIEAAGRRAYGMPIGFLELMDNTGLPVGLFSMRSFSDSSNPDDPLFKVYGNFFAPRGNYIRLVEEFDKAEDKSSVRWVKEEHKAQKAKGEKVVEELKDRFLAIGFTTASEVVDAELITIEDLERLTQNAFIWRQGPFTLMNRLGMEKVKEVVEGRVRLAKELGQDFPRPKTLEKRFAKAERWDFQLPPVFSTKEMGGAVRRITLSNPQAANAMDNTVFEEWKRQFGEANEDPECKVIIFDTAPIKTFIAGAHVPTFIERIKEGNFEQIKRDTAMWQEVIFHYMTGTDKPKIAIVDGQTLGGGVEVASAFAVDANSVVLITNRTSFTLPETRLGIYPGLRGTLLLPQIIYRALNDEEKAVALSRYYILAGGTTITSPQVISYLGFADFVVPAHRRDEVAGTIARAIIDNSGKIPSGEELARLEFERLPQNPTFDEREELNSMTDLFLPEDLIPTLYAYARGGAELFFCGRMKAHGLRIARRVAACSPNAVWTANWLISKGFDGFLKGVDNESMAQYELEEHLIPTFKHPDALIGLEALMSREFPAFRRRYPF